MDRGLVFSQVIPFPLLVHQREGVPISVTQSHPLMASPRVGQNTDMLLSTLRNYVPLDRGQPRKTLAEAVEQFLESRRQPEFAFGTYRNHRRILRHFLRLAESEGIEFVDFVPVDFIDLYRQSRPIQVITWRKELEILRCFFRWCQDRDYCDRNPAKLVRTPKINRKKKEIYTPEEIGQILQACDRFGRTRYERLRARAIVQAFRFTALRLSDVALLKRSDIKDGVLTITTLKNEVEVVRRVHPELQQALDALPRPRNADPETDYYFWSGRGSIRALRRGVTRTMNRVFALSEVKKRNNPNHTFRHTLASLMLAEGATAEEIGVCIGCSPAMVRRHYGQVTVKQRDRIESLLQTVFEVQLAS